MKMNTTRALALLLTGALFGFGCSGDEEHGHEHDVEHEAEIWESAYESNLGKSDSASCNSFGIPDQGGFGKRVALTFDDGPHPTRTPQLLDFLKSVGIEATFFVNGKQLRDRSSRRILERIVNDGHILANHSTNHGRMDQMSAEKVRSEVHTTDKYISEFTNPRYFRFPYGMSSCKAKSIVSESGYITTGWTVDSNDWCFASDRNGGVGSCTYQYGNGSYAVAEEFQNDMIGNVLAQAAQNDGGVFLFHDVHQHTVDSIPLLVSLLRAKGYKFTNLDDTQTFPQLNGSAVTTTPEPPVAPEPPVTEPEPEPEPEPPVADEWPSRDSSRPFIGNYCAQNNQCGFRVGSTYGKCKKKRLLFSNDGVCTMNCAGFCPDMAGQPSTFCANLGESVGSCLGMCRTNSDCPGDTQCVALNRHIGGSSAAPKVGKVCVFSEWLR